ncbi:hypothetical protein [Leptospira weilii]|uniref:Uncharacterized protein n=1 Tax=Leptospira weilii str. UI 13098 TaxID=1088542 RepID=M6QBQ9_9LEPT|nr:hypothetical protein [Leptospira weilii]EMN90028.1 hypothetical protein LEP1GSC108_4832 [Leptospira weilii str. UI 13098]OMI18719.1 hypothetical protein BUQ74_03710 [Leptospira weilii serovar Heyan]
MWTRIRSWIRKIKSRIALLLIVLKLFVYGCEEKNTEDPAAAYLYWSGDRTVPNNLELIHGKYWESAHWSHEHILFLELKAPLPWREEFKRLNHLIEVKPDGGLPSENAPKWFRPPKYYKVLISNTEHGQGSVYYENQKTGHIFLYDVQL